MGISNEQKKDILKRVFITGGIYPPKEFEKLKNLSQNEIDFLKAQEHVYYGHMLSNGVYGEKKYSHNYWQFGNTVVDKLLSSVLTRQNDLKKAREDANRAFKVYMEYRKLVKSGELSYSEELVRKNYNELKGNWIKSSQKVQMCKKYLCQDECLFSKFMEFIKLI